MLIEFRYSNLFLIALIGLLIFNISCDKKERYEGLYKAQGEELQKPSEIYIELKDNGQGIWRVIDDEASFIWSINNDEIRLHTKSGGVIIGKIQGDILVISLPGSKIKYFIKVK